MWWIVYGRKVTPRYLSVHLQEVSKTLMFLYASFSVIIVLLVLLHNIGKYRLSILFNSFQHRITLEKGKNQEAFS
jgi:hypothetical protein